MRAALRAVFAFCFLLLLVGVARAAPELGLRLRDGPATSQGVRIEHVEPGSPAAAEEIKPGDYIVEAAEEAVTSAQDVADKVRRAYQQGKKSFLFLLARGDDLRFVALRFPPETAAPAPAPTPAPAPVADETVQRGQVGIRVQTVTPEMGRGTGALIARVLPGSPAAAENLQPGDIVREVAQEPVTSADEAANKIQREFAAGKNSVLLLIDRQGDLRFVALRFAEGPVTAPAPRPAPANPPVAVAPPEPPPAPPPVQATPRPAPAPLPPVQEFDTAQGGAADAGVPPAQSLETGPSGSDNAALLQRLKEQQARLQQAEEQRRQAEAEAQAAREAAAREAAREPFSLSRDIPASFGVIWEYVPKWVFLVAILIGAFLHQNVVLKVASGVFFFCQIALMGMSQLGFLETLLMPLRFWFVVPFQYLGGGQLPGMPGLTTASLYPALSLVGYVAAIYYVGADTRRYEWERLRGLSQNGLKPFLKDWRERREIARERRALEQAERAAAWQQQPGYAGHPYPPPYAYPAPRTPLSEWFKTAYWAARLLILATAVIWLIWSTQEVLSILGALLPAPLRDLFADLLGRASEMVRTPTTR